MSSSQQKHQEKSYYENRRNQGDVLIRPISKLPEGLTKLDTLVLQEGETGNKHRFLPGSQVVVYQDPMYTQGDVATTITPNLGKYLEVLAPSSLVHEEHKTHVIEPGVYEIDIRREYDYEADEMRRVVD